MALQRIAPTEKLKESFPKINAGIDASERAELKSNEAKTTSIGALDTANEAKETANGIDSKATQALSKSNEAINTSNTAKTTADSTRDEMTNIIREQTAGADVVPEVVQARGDNATLGERLEKDLNKNPIYLTDYGVSHTKTADENTPLFQQAIDDAQLTGRPVELPWVPSDQWIDINKAILIAISGIHVKTHGLQTRIRQLVFPNPVFDVIVHDVTIDSFSATSAPFNASGYTTTYRGHLLQSYHAAVAIYADRVTVNDIKAHNYVAGVLVYAWDVNLDIKRGPLLNVVINGLEVSDVSFGLLAQDNENLFFDKIKGSYKLMPGVPTPPHLIYFVNGDYGNINVNGGTANAYNGEYSSAYQFKGMVGGEVSKLIARNSMGTLNLMHNKDFRVKDVIHIEDKNDDVQYGSVYMQSDNENCIIDNIYLDIVGDGKGVQTDSASLDCKILNVIVKTNHTTESPANSYDVDIQGTNVVAENITVENRGTHHRTASIGIWGGTGNTISNPKTSGNERGVVVRSGTEHTVKNYDMEKLGFVGGYAGSIALQSLVPVTLHQNTRAANGIGSQDRLLAFERFNVLSPGSSGIRMGTTTSGHTWTEISGTWMVENNRGFLFKGSSGLTYVDIGKSNVEMKSGIQLKDRENLSLRVIDGSNYLFVRLSQTTNMVELYKRDSGASTLLGSIAHSAQVGRRYEMKAQLFKDVIDIYVDGQFVLSHTLSAEDLTKFGTSTKFGIGGNTSPGGGFDNIEWRSLE